jgi:hypothetical protein
MQTYRNPRWSLVIQSALSSLMGLIGLSIAIHPGNASHPGTAPGYIAFGSVMTAACIFLLVAQLTSRLVVAEHGLTWRSMMRTRSIDWADIEDVLVMRANSFGPWYSPGIKTGGRLRRINSVIGPRRYTESIVTAIRGARPQPRTATSAYPRA